MSGRLTRRAALISLGALAASCGTPQRARAPARFTETVLKARDGREVAVRLALPSNARRVGFVTFSHGANSNARLYDRVLEPLARAGFLVAAPTHVDAESNPRRSAYDATAVLETRIADLRLVAQCAAQLAAVAELAPRALDESAFVAAGHSYGALLALYLVGATGRTRSGAKFGIRDERYRCALAMSPPGPLPGYLETEQFDSIAAPLMVTTGRRDVLPNFVPDWPLHLAAFERSTVRPAYGVILQDVDHYFGGLICRFEAPGPPQGASLTATLDLATLFARSVARRDQAAAARLMRIAAEPRRLTPALEVRSRV